MLSIGPGVRGNWSVKSNATLVFTSPGIYNFHGLFLEPSSTVRLPSQGVTQIYVDDGLILRSRLGNGVNTILGYFGQNAVHVESTFNGQLLFAPNATVEIKSNVFGRVFAENLVVHQDRVVTGRPMTAEARALYMPAERVNPLGVMGPGFPGADELASAVFPPAFAPQCASTTPIALVSHYSRGVTRANLDLAGGVFFNSQELTAFLGFPFDPPACIPTVFPNFFQFEPWLSPLYPATVPDPNAVSYYGPSLTDNLMGRLPGGRALQVGFTSRVCADPPGPQGANCPPVLSEGVACEPAVSPNVCYYGGGIPTNFDADKNCLCVDPQGDPPSVGAGYTPVWVCRTRRLEAGALAVRMSSTCGSGWTTGAIDLHELGITALPPAAPDTLRNVDRPDLHVDPFDDRVLVSGNWGPGFTITQNIVVEGRPKSATNANDIRWTIFRNDPSTAVFAPRVMTTVRDERALLSLSPPSYGPFVHFASLYCRNGTPFLDIQTPFGRREWDLVGDSPPPERLCRQVSKSVNGMPFFGIHFGPSIAAISSAPPRFLVAYSGRTSTDFELTNLYMVTLRSAGGYAEPPEIRFLGTVRLGDPPVGHVIFPHLVQADHLAGSDLGFDAPIILRVVSVFGDTIREHAIPFYSGLGGSLHDLASWSLAEAYPGQVCDDSIDFECFVGDYRYASLMEKSGDTLRFFTPWIGGNPGGAASTSIQGAIFDVDP